VHWGERLRGRALLAFIDNETSQGGITNGFSTSPIFCRVIHAIWTLCARYEITLWLERVPTKLNCSDGPSRNCFKLTDKAGIRRVSAAACYKEDLLKDVSFREGVNEPDTSHYMVGRAERRARAAAR